MENLRFGTMYEGGMPISPSSNANATMGLTLGDTVPGKEIRWLEFKNLLIADRCVCTGVSWDDLRQAGLLDGKPVKIDGKDYLCRSLKVGSMPGEPNEWDDALNALGEDDKDWHWLGDKFWGQETAEEDRSCGVLRGSIYPRKRTFELKNARYVGGFRPVLEPLSAFTDLSEKLIGSTIKIWGPRRAAIEGQLVDFDDYDVTLSTMEILPCSRNWGCTDEGEIIISREKISALWQCN